mmetsp:Transcript_31335/g.73070  ORF Transcript_31335/g.73070 Transcript_31335/m.73070 type:complete len:225 (-) Transcript_31335:601-1275(-)
MRAVLGVHISVILYIHVISVQVGSATVASPINLHGERRDPVAKLINGAHCPLYHLVLGVILDISALKAHLLLSRCLEVIEHLGEGHPKLLRGFQHIVRELLLHYDRLLHELLRGLLAPKEESRQVVIADTQPLHAGGQNILADLRWSEGQLQVELRKLALRFAGFLLLQLHKVPDDARNLRVDLTGGSELLQQPHHCLDAIEIALVQVHHDNGVRTETVRHLRE